MQTVKMVVTGPFSAGKTEFIQSVSEIDVVSTERKISSQAERTVKESTTVAMDFGRITVDEDLVRDLRGVSGRPVLTNRAAKLSPDQIAEEIIKIALGGLLRPQARLGRR